MNTPAHVAASILLWRNEESRHAPLAVCLGAILPDAPMFVFYAIQKILGHTERDIWGTQYFRDDWQLFFDIFNSIPLAMVLILVANRLQYRFVALVGMSSLTHLLFDLPVHHDDAHRHFLPLTDWRFQSPVSYWDADHHGRTFAIIELSAAISACIYVWFRGQSQGMRTAAKGTLWVYAAGLGLASWFLLRRNSS